MKKHSKIKRAIVGLALVSALAFTAAGCGGEDNVINEKFNDSQATAIEDVRADLLRDLGDDTGYKVLSIDGFKGRPEQKEWTMYTTARQSGDRESKSFTVEFTGYDVEKINYITNVSTSINTCHTSFSYETAYDVYDSMFDLVRYTSRNGEIAYERVQDLAPLYSDGATAEQKNDYFTMARSFCDAKNDDAYNQIMSKFYSKKATLGEIEYEVTGKNGDWSAVLQQSAVDETTEATFLAYLEFKTENLNANMVLEATKKFIESKGTLSKVVVKDNVGDDCDVIVELVDVTFASNLLEDVSKTVINKIDEAVKNAEKEVDNQVNA